jgi:hypothetical protein
MKAILNGLRRATAFLRGARERQHGGGTTVAPMLGRPQSSPRWNTQMLATNMIK